MRRLTRGARLALARQSHRTADRRIGYDVARGRDPLDAALAHIYERPIAAMWDMHTALQAVLDAPPELIRVDERGGRYIAIADLLALPIGP